MSHDVLDGLNLPSPDPHGAAPTSDLLVTRVVSLSQAMDRRAAMRAQLGPTGLDWAFFDAHTAVNPRLTVDWARHRRINGRSLTAAELGCYSSHWTLLSAHAAGPAKAVLLVLEDDAILDPLFFADTAQIVRLARRYGMIRFGGHLTRPSEEEEILGRRRVVRFKAPIFGTLAYAVSGAAASILASHLQDLLRPVDVGFDRFWDHGVGIYCVYPYPAIERSEPSQIGDRRFERLPLGQHLMWKAANQLEKARCALANVVRAGPRGGA